MPIPGVGPDEPVEKCRLLFSTDLMAIYKKYLIPNTIEEALQAMQDGPVDGRFIAGGTDLLLDLQQGRHPPVQMLVDITRIPDLCRLEIQEGRLFIGAAVPLNRIISAQLVFEHAQCLFEAAGLIGGPQVRNTATLGGNVVHGLPAADGAIALHALGASAEIASLSGRRQLSVHELYRGPGQTALQPQKELLIGFSVSLRGRGEASAFKRVMRPQGVALPIINLAIWVRRKSDVVDDIRIAVGPGGPVPFRARAAEQVLAGRPLSGGLMQEALDAIREEARFRKSAYRSGIDYRRHLTRVLFEDTFLCAWERALQDIPE